MNILQYIYYFFRSIRYRGFIFTLKLLYFEFYYERKLGIKTLQIANLESLNTINNDYENNHHYQGASYYVLSILFKKIKKYSTDKTFIDYGCGKGRVLIMAALEGFDPIKGIDLAKELCEISLTNIERVRTKIGNTKIEVVQADATNYTSIDDIHIFFFFNPFGRLVMNQVVNQIEQSKLRNPRTVYIIYVNPLYVDCFIHANYEVLEEIHSKEYTEGIILKK
ncbi:MAG: class I SAM-dependent methyltransferase [Bacteroidota bacterium]